MFYLRVHEVMHKLWYLCECVCVNSRNSSIYSLNQIDHSCELKLSIHILPAFPFKRIKKKITHAPMFPPDPGYCLVA